MDESKSRFKFFILFLLVVILLNNEFFSVFFFETFKLKIVSLLVKFFFKKVIFSNLLLLFVEILFNIKATLNGEIPLRVVGFSIIFARINGFIIKGLSLLSMSSLLYFLLC